MSKREREAFEDGAALGRSLYDWEDEGYHDEVKRESHNRYPDSPCKNVRDIVVEYLKANGYKGLWNDDCWCHLSGLFDCPDEYGCEVLKACIPGILLDGKIVPKEST